MENLKRRKGTNLSTTADNILMILVHLEENSHISIRAVATETGLSKSSVHKMVKQNRYHPYKMTKVQHLRITDSQHFTTFV